MQNMTLKRKYTAGSLCFLLMLAIVLLFTACSFKDSQKNNTDTDNKTTQDMTEYTYVPSFYELDIGDQWINSISVLKDEVIVIATDFYMRPISSVHAVNMDSGVVSDADLGIDNERYICEVAAMENGYVVYSEEYYTEEEHNGYGNLPRKGAYLTYFDENFNFVSETDISDFVDTINYNSTFYYDCMAADNDGNVYFSYGGSIYSVDKAGRLTAKLDLNGISAAGMACVENQIVVLYRNSINEYEAALLDMQNYTLGEALKNIPDCGYSASIFAGEGDTLYFAGDYNVTSYHLDSAQYEECFKWTDCDMSGLGNYEHIAAEGRFLCSEQTSSGFGLAVINKVNKADVKEKITLTVTMIEKYSIIIEEICRFNRQNQEYRLEPRYYTEEFPDADSLQKAVTQFNIDLIEGDIGDIIIVTPELDYYNLASKGAFSDLAELMAQDEEIKESDFIENIIDLLKVDGKLCAIAPSFLITTLVGKAANVGYNESWSTDDIINMLDKHKDSTLVYGMNNINALRMFLMYSMDAYYDFVTGECHFDSEEFKKLLEITAGFPDKTDGEYVFSRKNYTDDVILLEKVYFSSFTEPQLFRGLFGEEVNFIGYPVTSGSGSAVSFGNVLYAISSSSEHKEVAWQYIRQYLTEEYQKNVQIPISKAVFEDRISNEMTKDTTNHGASFESFRTDLEPLSEADADSIRNLVYGATRSDFYNCEIMSIILEEAAAYFSGQKTVDEAADIIQSRVSVYVDERR